MSTEHKIGKASSSMIRITQKPTRICTSTHKVRREGFARRSSAATVRYHFPEAGQGKHERAGVDALGLTSPVICVTAATSRGPRNELDLSVIEYRPNQRDDCSGGTSSLKHDRANAWKLPYKAEGTTIRSTQLMPLASTTPGYGSHLQRRSRAGRSATLNARRPDPTEVRSSSTTLGTRPSSDSSS